MVPALEPSNKFNSVTVEVTPSKVFNSAAVVVTATPPIINLSLTTSITVEPAVNSLSALSSQSR